MNATELMKKSDVSLKARRQIIAEKKDNPNEPFDLEGVRVRYTPHYSTRYTNITLVHIGPDDTVYALEYHYTPWNIFKESKVWHSFELNCKSPREVLNKLNQAGVKGMAEQDPYANPPLYHASLGEDVLDCVKLYKILK